MFPFLCLLLRNGSASVRYSVEKKRELQVAALENGTAIDHIPPSQLFKVAKLLGLENMDNTITIGNNFQSKKMGCKGVIKISNKFFEEDEINRIALIAPKVILNIIRDYEVVEKKTVTLPDELVGLVKCNNPKCITNNEPGGDMVDSSSVLQSGNLQFSFLFY